MTSTPTQLSGRNVPVQDLGEGYPEAPNRGNRRRKVANYLKAANKTWQSYQDSASTKWDNRGVDQGQEENVPGAFPDVSIIRNGGEEMILFPSYCKRHIKTLKNNGLDDESLKTETGERTEDSEWWRQEWEKYENDKAIVDVDVRGWVYTPHKGPFNRKHRFLLGLARRLSGVPAPKTPGTSRETSPGPMTVKARHEAHEALREQERIEMEAEEIMRKGETEAEVAARGGYSEDRKGRISDTESLHGYGRRMQSDASTTTTDAPGPGSLSKRSSWNQPADMSPEELSAANDNLMARIMPFVTNPLVSTPITVFFYDENNSQSKTVTTNEAGHFNLRAALDFVPTHVRVLASENLSATEEVKITEPQGVSVITDVDDTVKHSSIGSGAREIFRNAFIRELSDLTIDGVREWYSTMYDMGVGFHYVSNSPWQLFPVLVTFFRTAGLPPGSYHLKQYTGMLQGIFEPVAERKKGTLERILRDFPERKFVLVGDSGEADLEVYTDVVMANPGRIVAVFIRDVTTSVEKPFFDESYTATITDKLSLPKPVNQGSSDASDHPTNRPPLPDRRSNSEPSQASQGPKMGILIDFGEEDSSAPPNASSDAELSQLQKGGTRSKSVGSKPPPRPAKPEALRSTSSVQQQSPLQPPGTPARNPPSTPNRRVNDPLSTVEKEKAKEEQQGEYSYMAAAKAKANRAYQAMPAVRGYLPGMSSGSSIASVKPFDSQTSTSGPPPLPRRGIKATAASYAYSAGSKISGYKSSVTDRARGVDRPASSSSDSSGLSTPPVNKKLELWKQRWARAQELLGREGVVLRSWRVGEDVADEAIRLVERELKEMGVEGYGKGKTGAGGGEAKVKDLKH